MNLRVLLVVIILISGCAAGPGPDPHPLPGPAPADLASPMPPDLITGPDLACGDTRYDPYNCGSCGSACPTFAHSTPGCMGGACTTACIPPYMRCAVAEPPGCNVNTGTDASNCGGCGNVCAAGKTCAGGSCT